MYIDVVQRDLGPSLDIWFGRWAQIAMGILVNFASDGQAALLVQETVLTVMESVHAQAGMLTLHAPFTTECAHCLTILCLSNRSSTSEVRLAHSPIAGTDLPCLGLPGAIDGVSHRPQARRMYPGHLL